MPRTKSRKPRRHSRRVPPPTVVTDVIPGSPITRTVVAVGAGQVGHVGHAIACSGRRHRRAVHHVDAVRRGRDVGQAWRCRSTQVEPSVFWLPVARRAAGRPECRGNARSFSEVDDCQKTSETPSSQCVRSRAIGPNPASDPVATRVSFRPGPRKRPTVALPMRSGVTTRCPAFAGRASRRGSSDRAVRQTKYVLLLLEFRSESALDSIEIRT